MKAIKLKVALLVAVGGLVLGCKKDKADVAAPVPVPREMRLKINGQQYVWPCRGGLRDISRTFVIIEAGEPQGPDGISITYREQPATSPRIYKPASANIVLNGITYRITGIGTSTSHINYLLGTYNENDAANKIMGTFTGEENQLGIRVEDGTFTTVIR